MVPVLLNRSQIDDQRWDELIERSQQRIVYGFSWYLDIVCEDWKAIVWPSVNHFQIVMPLPVRKKWSFSVIEQPLFCQYLGMFSESDLTAQQASEFLHLLDCSFSYISAYNFHPMNHLSIKDLVSRHKHFKIRQNHTQWLYLHESVNEIQNGFSKDRKLNLRKAGKFSWAIEVSEDILPLIDLFRNHHAKQIRGGVNNQAYELLRTLFHELISKGCAELWYASVDNTLHAGALLVRDHHMAVYLFNAADEVGRKGNARSFLLNEFFRMHAGKQIFFDFESPDIVAIDNFYKSFGGDARPYLTIAKNDLPLLLKQIQNLRKKLWIRTR